MVERDFRPRYPLTCLRFISKSFFHPSRRALTLKIYLHVNFESTLKASQKIFNYAIDKLSANDKREK